MMSFVPRRAHNDIYDIVNTIIADGLARLDDLNANACKPVTMLSLLQVMAVLAMSPMPTPLALHPLVSLRSVRECQPTTEHTTS